mmetsp:Transcript_4588/g.8655  ORF Transcript_4588/g.8655 Transcript_4588/m.8655 type:complete len:247 (-) Transcript_4588:564-1304(-)
MVVEKNRHTTAESTPMHSAPRGPVNPEAGVMAASPAMEPVHMPTRDALPVSAMSCSIHTSAAVAALICVDSAAYAAPDPAAMAEPPLNPYQPTQSMPVPRQVRVMFPHASLFSLRGPSMMAPTSAPMPAVMCTTMPPAKSSTPMSAKKPPAPPHTMWQAGKYTANAHMNTYHITALNFMRWTKDPTMSAGVMMANVIWNRHQSASGMVPVRDSAVTPVRNALSSPPMMDGRPRAPSTMPTVEKLRE